MEKDSSLKESTRGERWEFSLRVGSKAQPYALKLVTGNLRYQLAQYREYKSLPNLIMILMMLLRYPK